MTRFQMCMACNVLMSIEIRFTREGASSLRFACLSCEPAPKSACVDDVADNARLGVSSSLNWLGRSPSSEPFLEG